MFKKRNIIFLLIMLGFVFTNIAHQTIHSNQNYKENREKLKAMMLSAVFAGAGQFYMKNYKDGIIYSYLDLISWKYRDKALSKSEDYTVIYKDYATENWSFSNWVENYYFFNDELNPLYNCFIYTNPETGISNYSNPWDQSHGIIFSYNNTIYNTNSFDNALDDFLIALCGVSYTEGCTKSIEYDNVINNVVVENDHHFYEGIGKYNVYFAGWDDAVSDSWNEQGVYNVAQSTHKKYYEDELRLKSKKQHDLAENILGVIFINHVVSMLDILVDFDNKNNMKMNSNFYLIDNKPFGTLDLSITW